MSLTEDSAVVEDPNSSTDDTGTTAAAAITAAATVVQSPGASHGLNGLMLNGLMFILSCSMRTISLVLQA